MILEKSLPNEGIEFSIHQSDVRRTTGMARSNRTQIRIIAGTLRGRKLACVVNEDLRPTPQMVREAFFSILGNAVPDRLFIDIFAGTGVVGMEALSRGASAAYLVERDLRLAQAIEKHLRQFDLSRSTKLFR